MVTSMTAMAEMQMDGAGSLAQELGSRNGSQPLAHLGGPTGFQKP